MLNNQMVGFVAFFFVSSYRYNLPHMFCRPHRPKVLRDCQVVHVLLSLGLVRFFSRAFLDRDLDPRKHRPYFRDPLPVKTQSFARESGFTSEGIHTRTVTRIYCSHLRTAIATFVVDMMARLPTDIRP